MRRTRLILAALIASSALTTSCDAAKKVLTNPLVTDLLKVVGPLVSLADPNLGAALNKTATVAEVLAAMQSTIGPQALTLNLANPLDQVTVQGGTFGVLSTQSYGLGSSTPVAIWTDLQTLINDLFAPGRTGQPWYDTVPMIYQGGSGGGTNPTPAPTVGPTMTPTTGSSPTPNPAPTPAQTQAPNGADGLPASYDLRQTPASGDLLGAIRDQGSRGTCVLFSICELLDYYYPGRVHSPEFLDWLYNLDIKSKIKQATLWQDTGTYPGKAITLLTPQGNPNPDQTLPYVPPSQGVPLESVAPYQDPLPSESTTASPGQVAPDWLGNSLAGELSSANGESLPTDLLQFYLLEDNLSSLKQAISDGNPVMIIVPCHEPDWDGTALAQSNDVIADYQGQTDSTGYHSILLVGYKDDPTQPGGGLFLIRNHWGSSWGDNGYAWMTFNTIVNYGASPYIAKPVSGSNQTTFTENEPPANPPS